MRDDGYRYGFQGQEQDKEWLGDQAVNYKYRVHDPRLGRFLSIDPLAPSYPHNSPYAFSENVVINAVELEGLEKVDVNPDGQHAQESTQVLTNLPGYTLNQETGETEEYDWSFLTDSPTEAYFRDHPTPTMQDSRTPTETTSIEAEKVNIANVGLAVGLVGNIATAPDVLQANVYGPAVRLSLRSTELTLTMAHGKTFNVPLKFGNIAYSKPNLVLNAPKSPLIPGTNAFNKVPKIVNFAGHVSGGAGVFSMGSSLYDMSQNGVGYSNSIDFTLGTVGTANYVAGLSGWTYGATGFTTGAGVSTGAIPFVGQVVGTLALWKWSFDMGGKFGPSKWYGKNDNKILE